MSKSQALAQFTNTLEIAEELMGIESSYKNPPKVGERKAVEGLRGSAAVLMVAGFERFLREAVEEHLAVLTVKPLRVSFGTLPEKMRIHNVFTTLDHATRGAPYEVSKNKVDRLPDIDAACREILSGTVNPRAFSATGGNPDSSTVKAIFANLGVTDIFGKLRVTFEQKWGKPEAHTFIPDKLNEIINRRHIVAHTATALNIGRSDLKEAVKFLRILANLIDSQIKAHVSQILESG